MWARTAQRLMRRFRVSLIVLPKMSARVRTEELALSAVNKFSPGSYLVTSVHDRIVCDYVNAACV